MARRGQTFGGMLAFIVAGDADTSLRRAARLCERLKAHAPSPAIAAL